jgi:hypothetical protein
VALYAFDINDYFFEECSEEFFAIAVRCSAGVPKAMKIRSQAL